jgi:uncharacterized surface protein with fasciclin (FAS1) repeats
MRKILFICGLCAVILGSHSCEPPEPLVAGFEDVEETSIYQFMADSVEAYSLFLQILEKGGIAKTLSAYNPDGQGYTLFLPDNRAVLDFVEKSKYADTTELLDDQEFVEELSRYHAVTNGISADDFPFGALPDYTFSNDYLIVSFIILPDTSYYVINNSTGVIFPNIELSNGYIHLIEDMLEPVTFTTYEWLADHDGFTIFKDLIDATGLKEKLDVDSKDITIKARPVTLLMEPDTVFNKYGVNSLADLAGLISPDSTNYTSTTNPLYNFAAYHILVGTMFLNDFIENDPTNYLTYSEIPVGINGRGLDITINKGKEIFDTLVDGEDTTFVDYVGFFYDESNIITRSGAIHFINHILKQHRPSRQTKNYEFWEDPLLSEYRSVNDPGEYLIEDTSWLEVIKWAGPDLILVLTGDEESSGAWNGDYLLMEGDFTITYTFPKIIPGKYDVFLGVDYLNSQNAVVEIYIDGKQLGGLRNLAGSSGDPFARLDLGTINFQKYEDHTFEIRSLIPGRLAWDYIRFEPI